MPRAVVVGGSLAGLTTAFALARVGWDVDVIERDPLPDAPDVETAFAHHPRPAVPQAGHSHNLFGAVYATWRDRAPDVVEALQKSGIGLLRVIEHAPPVVAASPPEQGDDDLVGLTTRRSTYEWALRRIVVQLPNVTPRVANVVGLAGERGAVPTVTAVRTDAGTVEADLVVDASGRRTSSSAWIVALGGREAPFESQSCEASYYTRYFRMYDAEASWPALNRGVAAGGQYQAHFGVCMPADHGAFSITLVVPPYAEPLRALRHPAVFDAVTQATPMVAPWWEFGTAISDVRIMAGFRNSARPEVAAAPYARNFVVLGDALMHTDPTFARGISVATMSAFHLADVVTDFVDPMDREAAWRSYLTDQVLTRYADVLDRSNERDASWTAVWSGDAPTQKPFAGDLAWMDVVRAMRVDATVWRTISRYLQVLARFEDTVSPELLDRVRELRDAGELPPVPMGPSADELRAVVEPALSAVG
jgi:2-polyprenyl-6-methoxyphenol hydroxylase-like FAD-dependent oxidoreductase